MICRWREKPGPPRTFRESSSDLYVSWEETKAGNKMKMANRRQVSWKGGTMARQHRLQGCCSALRTRPGVTRSRECGVAGCEPISTPRCQLQQWDPRPRLSSTLKTELRDSPTGPTSQHLHVYYHVEPADGVEVPGYTTAGNGWERLGRAAPRSFHRKSISYRGLLMRHVASTDAGKPDNFIKPDDFNFVRL